MPQSLFDETKATARLSNLDIEIVHSRSSAGDAELARHRRGKASIQEFRSPAGYGGVRGA